MLEAYSLNVEVAQNDSIPFNNISLAKGCSAVLSAPGTVQFNKSGVYMVDVDASIASTAAGQVSIQLAKQGILEPGAIAVASAAASTVTPLNITSLIQVNRNNQPCCCSSSPVTLQVINTGQAGTYPIAHVVITKVC